VVTRTPKSFVAIPKTVGLPVLDYIDGEEDLVFTTNPLLAGLDCLPVSQCSVALVVLRSEGVKNRRL